MSETVSSILEFLGDAVSNLLSWVLGFFKDIFTGDTIKAFGSAIVGVFTGGSFDFSIKSLFELLFGVAFLIFAIKLLVNLIRG